MADFLQLPLNLQSNSFFERTSNEDEAIGQRILFFFLSDATQHFGTRVSVLSQFWEALYFGGSTSGVAEFFHSKGAKNFEEDLREQMNIWLNGFGYVKMVKLSGETNKRGTLNILYFATQNRAYLISIYSRSSNQPRDGVVGDWAFSMSSNAITR